MSEKNSNVFISIVKGLAVLGISSGAHIWGEGNISFTGGAIILSIVAAVFHEFIIGYIIGLFEKDRKLQRKDVYIILGSISGLIIWLGLSFGVGRYVIVFSVMLVFILATVAFFFVYLLAIYQICWTRVQEGQIVVARRGKSVERYLARIKDHTIDPITGEITKADKPRDKKDKDSDDSDDKTTDDKKDAVKEKGGLIERIMGAYWMGLWPFIDVYRYRFTWLKYTHQHGKEDYAIQPRDEVVKTLYFRYVYPMKSKGEVETVDKIPIGLLALTTIEIVNAERALFKTSDWLAQVTGAVQATMRDYAGARTYEDIIKDQNEGNTIKKDKGQNESDSVKKDKGQNESDSVKKDKGQNEEGDSGFFRMIDGLNNPTPGGNLGIIALYGVKIVFTNLLSVDIADNYRQETTRQYVAEQRAKAIREEGAAIAEATRKKYAAIAKFGTGIAMAEAIKETSLNTLVIGETVLPTIPLGEGRSSPKQPDKGESEKTSSDKK